MCFTTVSRWLARPCAGVALGSKPSVSATSTTFSAMARQSSWVKELNRLAKPRFCRQLVRLDKNSLRSILSEFTQEFAASKVSIERGLRPLACFLMVATALCKSYRAHWRTLRAGPEAYTKCLSALDRGESGNSHHGNWWNVMVWSECRMMGGMFFELIELEGKAQKKPVEMGLERKRM